MKIKNIIQNYNIEFQDFLCYLDDNNCFYTGRKKDNYEISEELVPLYVYGYLRERFGDEDERITILAENYPESEVWVELAGQQYEEEFGEDDERVVALHEDSTFSHGFIQDVQRREEERYENERRESKKIREACAQMLISSGFSFEGYRIVKYSGYISGDDAVQIPRSGVFGGHNGSNLTNALVQIRRQALKELKEAAYHLGCNAVIGVDFDYITIEPETANITGGTLYEPYVICVTANGNAVVIEKIEE